MGRLPVWGCEVQVRAVSLSVEIEHRLQGAGGCVGGAVAHRAGPQFCSMKLTTELWSITRLSTKFDFEYGETTSNGRRGPSPQRPCSGMLA